MVLIVSQVFSIIAVECLCVYHQVSMAAIDYIVYSNSIFLFISCMSNKKDLMESYWNDSKSWIAIITISSVRFSGNVVYDLYNILNIGNRMRILMIYVLTFHFI